jgi:hypothetical protein
MYGLIAVGALWALALAWTVRQGAREEAGATLRARMWRVLDHAKEQARRSGGIRRWGE